MNIMVPILFEMYEIIVFDLYNERPAVSVESECGRSNGYTIIIWI